MSRNTSDPVSATISFDVRFMRKGRHSVVLALPEAFHACIGLVVVHWGTFELTFDRCLGALIAGEAADGRARDTKGWEARGFKKRRELFKTICSEWLMTWKPEAAQELIDLLDKASSLHVDRNLIAHGTYGFTVPPHSAVATDCYAFSAASGRKLRFDEDSLKKLYHDISHLTADVMFIFNRFAKVSGGPMLVADDEVLRIYRETDHPWNPNPARRTRLG